MESTVFSEFFQNVEEGVLAFWKKSGGKLFSVFLHLYFFENFPRVAFSYTPSGEQVLRST
jgi:hypothetical protein